MKKTVNSRIKLCVIVILCVLGIAAFVAYFMKLSVLRWIAISLFFLAATIHALYSHPKQSWASIFLIVICTAIVTFAPMMIDYGTKTDGKPSSSHALVSSVVTTSSIISCEPLQNLTMLIYPAEKADWDMIKTWQERRIDRCNLGCKPGSMCLRLDTS